MAKFMIEASYTAEGSKGLISGGGSARRTAIREMTEALGGKVEALYFAFGKHDVYVVLDLPDNIAASAIALAVKASGALVTRTIVLVTPEELDQATKKSVNYRAPGK
jgi:uncharacterized protein with GYD domain